MFYVLVHMYGNLKIFAGVDAFNDYAEHLRTSLTPFLPYGGLLWILRVVLIVGLVGHVYAAFYLWGRAGSARTHPLRRQGRARRCVKSKMMRWGGVALLLFLVWHLLQFTIVKFNVGSLPAPTGNPGPARRQQLPGAVGRPDLPARDGRPGPAPLPRRLERHADPRLGRQRRRTAAAPRRIGDGLAAVIERAGSSSRCSRSPSA